MTFSLLKKNEIFIYNAYLVTELTDLNDSDVFYMYKGARCAPYEALHREFFEFTE